MKLIERFLVYYCYVFGLFNVRLIERKFMYIKKVFGINLF